MSAGLEEKWKKGGAELLTEPVFLRSMKSPETSLFAENEDIAVDFTDDDRT